MLHHQHERVKWIVTESSFFFFFFFLFSPRASTKNCFIDHKLRLASRWRFSYNRKRWNINIVLAHTKCKTVWLRTVSGKFFMLMMCVASRELSWILTSWKLLQIFIKVLHREKQKHKINSTEQNTRKTLLGRCFLNNEISFEIKSVVDDEKCWKVKVLNCYKNNKQF